MKESTHEQRLKSIEAECAELRRQILKLEFQHKKDVIEARREHDVFKRESDESWQRFERLREQGQKHLNHLTQLTGIAFETFEELDERLDTASKALARKRQKSD